MVEQVPGLLSRREGEMAIPAQRRSARIPLGEALSLAARNGVGASIRCGIVLSTREVLVGLTTVDNAPMLTIRDDSGGSERWLVAREQSGPDRWDYPASFLQRSERYFLRLTMADRFEDVEFEPAAVAVMSEYGWTDDVSLTGEAIVERRTLAAAFQLLGVDLAE